MRCPNDQVDLVESDIHGVSVRTCPACQGIWLERESLDSIVDQSIVSQYASGVDDIDDLDELDDGARKNRRRDKYSEDFDDFDRPRKSKRKKPRRERFDEFADF